MGFKIQGLVRDSPYLGSGFRGLGLLRVELSGLGFGLGAWGSRVSFQGPNLEYRGLEPIHLTSEVRKASIDLCIAFFRGLFCSAL